MSELLVQLMETEDGSVKGHLPSRSHPTDAGLDLKCVVDVTIPAQETVPAHTGVAVKLPPNTCGMIWDRSGYAKNLGITTVGGLIDESYTGELIALLRNESFKDVEFKAGTRVAQLVIVPILLPEIKVVDKLPSTDRGSNGFGSTGEV